MADELTTNPFKPGDIVHLKSGSSRFTIGEVEGGDCRCFWVEYNTQELRQGIIPAACLEFHTHNSRA